MIAKEALVQGLEKVDPGREMIILPAKADPVRDLEGHFLPAIGNPHAGGEAEFRNAIPGILRQVGPSFPGALAN